MLLIFKIDIYIKLLLFWSSLSLGDKIIFENEVYE